MTSCVIRCGLIYYKKTKILKILLFLMNPWHANSNPFSLYKYKNNSKIYYTKLFNIIHKIFFFLMTRTPLDVYIESLVVHRSRSRVVSFLRVRDIPGQSACLGDSPTGTDRLYFPLIFHSLV